jgi:hypothetical protein
LVAEDTTAAGIGFWLAMELILMTLPRSEPKYLSASREARSVPSTLMLNWRWTSSSVSSSIGAKR